MYKIRSQTKISICIDPVHYYFMLGYFQLKPQVLLFIFMYLLYFLILMSIISVDFEIFFIKLNSRQLYETVNLYLQELQQILRYNLTHFFMRIVLLIFSILRVLDQFYYPQYILNHLGHVFNVQNHAIYQYPRKSIYS